MIKIMCKSGIQCLECMETILKRRLLNFQLYLTSKSVLAKMAFCIAWKNKTYKKMTKYECCGLSRDH